MAEIKFQELDQYLNKLNTNNIPYTFLIYGEKFLTSKAFDKTLDFLIPKTERQLGYESLEGDDATIPEIIERISTYSITQNRLVVAARDIPLFPGSGHPKAAGFSKHNIESLAKLIEKGFPPGHYLVLTTSSADKRRALFKVIKSFGTAIDCTAPSGNRQTDQNSRTNILHSIMQNILRQTGKSMGNNAFNKLVENTGFEPAVFADNLEKLVSFTGKRKKIILKDVESLVKRTKSDPVFELTNAIAVKDTEKALFYKKSLTNSGFHPLQILAAIANQIRKLIIAKNFIEQSKCKKRNIWNKNQSYNQFLQITMPEIIIYDKKLLEKIASWDGNDSQKNQKNNFKDIFIASNPKNAYPVYQTFLKSDNFSAKELAVALIAIGELDFILKSSSGDQDVLIENLIIKICL